ITGPFNGKVPEAGAARKRLFTCTPAAPKDEEPCAARILTALARRAYRRPLTATDAQTLFQFYKTGRAKGGVDDGIENDVMRVLSAPHFILLAERDPANAKRGQPYHLTDLELASRLSFFLWSSIPDDQLINLAAQGRLKDPVVLEQQVKRMIADDRANALL